MDTASLRAVLSLHHGGPRPGDCPLHLQPPQASGRLNPTMPGDVIILRNNIFVDIIKLKCDHTGVQQALDPVKLAGVPMGKGKGNTGEKVTKTELNTRSKADGKGGGRG